MPARTSADVRAAIAEDCRAHPDDSNATIARRHGCSATLVLTIKRAEGLAPAAGQASEHATSQTQNAVKARLADMAERRARLAQRMLEASERLVDSLYQPHIAFNFGGKDNTYTEHMFDQPDVKAKQITLTAAAIAVDKHLKLLQFDAGSDNSEAASLLGKLGEALSDRFGDGAGHRAPQLDLELGEDE